MKLVVIAAMVLFAGASLNAQAPAFATAPARTAATESIESARELYASARYDEALAVLNALGALDESAAGDRKLVEQYRSLCLLALGRGEEAERAIATLVRIDPFYQPGEADASPRVRTTFADVRQRLLPDLATSRYAEAKQAYDGKAFADAAARFREVVALLDDPQMNGRLTDLRTLAAGFVDLAAAAATPPPAPEPVKEEPAPPKEPAAPPVPLIYSADEPGIVPPVALRQEVPPVPVGIANLVNDKGVLELVIDEEGRVVLITVRSRVHPRYDSILTNAARDWRYQPARLNGTPVKFRKLLQISVKR